MEALGVTVGAVYKWEAGLSQPELNLVAEMADFFDTSVDVLLGYRMKDNNLDSAVDRISQYCRTMNPEALTEAEKTLGRYPNSFKAVYACAQVYLVFGAGIILNAFGSTALLAFCTLGFAVTAVILLFSPQIKEL